MQFFIALGLLISLASAYLLHQFWSRTFDGGTISDADAASDAGDRQDDALKAA